MATKLTGQQFIDAAIILGEARVLSRMHHSTGLINWGSPTRMRDAFDMYNSHNPKLGMGCAPCHVKVFNWLLDQIFHGVKTDVMAFESMSKKMCDPGCSLPSSTPIKVATTQPISFWKSLLVLR